MIVQPPAGIDVPLAIVMLPLPAVAVTFAQVPVFPAGLIVIGPGAAGKVSVKTALVVIATPLVLPIVIVSEVLPPGAKLVAPNALVTVGGVPTLTLAEAAAGLLPTLVTSAPAAIVLV